jgi:hypothetical protein
MSLTLLQTIQKVCKRIGILAPNAAFTSTDLQIQQLVELCEEEGQEQAARYQWQALQTEAIFTTVAAQLQGTLSTIAPGCEYIVNDTIWNRTLRRPVYGPRSEQEWQQIKAIQINGPFNSYRIIADAINFYPDPVAGQTCAFEYMSKNWVNSAGGGTSSVWTSDTDTAKLNDRLMLLGTRWRWKAAKGLDYSEDFASYEAIITDAMGRDASKPRLSMSGTIYEIQPVIAIPRGSWGVN